MSQPPYGSDGQWNQAAGGEPGQPDYGQPQPSYDQQQAYPQQPAYGAQSGYDQQVYPQQPGADGQQWGAQQPWASAPQKSGNGKLIGIIVGALVLIGAVVLVLVLTLGGGRSAKEAATGFMDAVVASDVDGAKEYSCAAVASSLSDAEGDSGVDGYELGEVKEDGDTATAEVTVHVGGETVTSELVLEKNSDGDFVVCDIQNADGSSSSSGSASSDGD